IDLAVLGRPTITRASRVEPDEQGRWRADLTPVDGPALGPFGRRSEARPAAGDWLGPPWLFASPPTSLLIALYTPADHPPPHPSHREPHPARPRGAPRSARRPRGRCAPRWGSGAGGRRTS